jgi:UDP-2,4-diacetamido-2,4,6-trideoxy-beta-L-altropyranose hydrolase
MTKAATMNVAFRADASLDIGIGHVMRCLTLADALREHGANCHFICREHPGHQLDQIRQRGFSVHVLSCCQTDERPKDRTSASQPAHSHWLGSDWQTDARQTDDILAELQPDWLVVDHYALDTRWEEALKGHYKKLLVIDDLADRPHACDLLLDQNLGREATDYAALVPGHCTVLAGPHYALLRPEFAALREYSLRRREVPALKRILITMGGVDQPNATGKVLEALKVCPLPHDCRITVVMGAQAPWLAQVHALAATLPWPTEVRVDISDMAQVMADSDLAIGAAGSTSWERCCLGLPTLLFVLAENQRDAARFLEEQQAVVTQHLGDGLPKRLIDQINLVVDAPDIMQRMVKRAAAITDGLGCERILAHLIGNPSP